MSEKTPNLKLMNDFIRSHFPEGIGEFKPVAYYDRHLDRLFVFFKDCSICEIYGTTLITLFEDLYPENGQAKYAGFSLNYLSLISRICSIDIGGRMVLSPMIKIIKNTRNIDLTVMDFIWEYFKAVYGDDEVNELVVNFDEK